MINEINNEINIIYTILKIKLSNIGFSMECFRADFLGFFSTNIKICLLGTRLDNHHLIKAYPGFWKK